MKTPVDTAKSRIVGYDVKWGELLIRAAYSGKKGPLEPYKEKLVANK